MKQCSPLNVGDLAEVILDLRLEYGDTDEYFYILQDSDYARIVKKYHCIGYSTMSRTVGMAIAMKMSHTALRERVGQEERYGKEAFDAFVSLLTKKLKDPAFGMLAPLAYFGGTYRCESEYYAKSNEFTWQPFYRGSETNVPMWKGRRIYKVNGQDIVEPYEDKQGLGNDLGATGVVDFYLPENEIQNSNSP